MVGDLFTDRYHFTHRAQQGLPAGALYKRCYSWLLFWNDVFVNTFRVAEAD